MKKNLIIIIFITVLIYLSPYLNVYSTNLEYDEHLMVSSLANKILGESSYNFEYLYDIEGEPSYILVEGTNSYLIYNRESKDFTEYSKYGKSIYDLLNQDEIKIYVGPTYYYFKKDNLIFDFESESPINNDELEKIIAIESNFKEKSKNEATNNRSSAYIANYGYFEHLDNNFGNNDTSNYPNSCSYIAIEMILSYYDTFLSDNIISEIYDVNVTKNFANFSNININSYDSSPGVDDIFHEHMIDIGIQNNFTAPCTYSLHLDYVDDLLNVYFYNSSNFANVNYYTGSSDSVFSLCQSSINNNKPLIVSLGFDAPGGGEYYHAVVAYGYENNTLVVHYGLHTTPSHIANVNKNLIACALEVYVSSSNIVQSNNYLWTIGTDSGHINGQGLVTCYHNNHFYNNYFEIAGHNMHCNCCGNNSLFPHNFVPQGLGYVCSVCGYFTRHPIIINSFEGME